ncbi:MAG: hypothetical protein HKM07_01055 [Chlamydiae bacterium]|nr:hypothetical protein [Chlamydiota bacterium]
MSSESGRILAANSQVIASLQEGDLLGYDQEGRLYVQKSGEESQKTQRVFEEAQAKTLKQEKGQAIVLATQKHFETLDSKEFLGTYRKVLQVINQDQVLSTVDKKNLVDALYQSHYKHLCNEGIDPVTAEATITIMMSFDPEVDPETKERISPSRATGGMSGAYYIRNREGEKIGVFKPRDEEPYMPNNPNRCKRRDTGAIRTEMRNGQASGTACYKEVIAYEVLGDFAPIPPTTFIEVYFPRSIREKDMELILKFGSFQRFVEGYTLDTIRNLDVESIPVLDLQKMASSDIVGYNADRSMGNMMYDSEKNQLHCIDQGVTFLSSLDWNLPPDDILAEVSCHWGDFPQCRGPILPEVKDWILGLDENKIESIIRSRMQMVLTQENAPSTGDLEKYINGIVVSNKTLILFIKKAAEKGCTLSQIGEMVMEIESENETDPKVPMIQKICREASAAREANNPNFLADPWKFVSDTMDKYLEDIH